MSNVLGERDIITPTRSDLELLRDAGARAQNYRLDHPAVPKRPFIKRLFRRPERHYHPSIGYYEHMPAWRVKTYVGDEIWNRYFKFSFERNPWDRQVSFYLYKSRNKKFTTSFDEFLRNKEKSFVDNYNLYMINGDMALDFIGMYENLEDDFKKALKIIGLEKDISLPKANVGSKSSQKSYRDYYNDDSKKLISRWYGPEIEAFGYEF